MRRLLRHRRLVLGAWLLLILALLPGLARLSSDNSSRVFFVEDAEALERFRRFEATFGGGGMLRLALSGEGLWTRQGLIWLGRLEHQTVVLPGVAAAAGLWGRHRLELLDWPPEDPAAFRRRALDDPLDRDAGWLSPDGELATVMVRTEQLSPAAQRRLLADLETLLAAAPPGVEGTLAGLPVLQRAMDEAFADIHTRFFPLLGVLAAVLLAAALGRVRDVALLLVFVAAILAALFGALGWAGVRLNLVTALLAPLVFVITLATAVHLLLAFRRHHRRQPGAPGAVLAAWREEGWAVLWTGLTTAVAFASFGTSPVPSVRSLGLSAALGLGGMTMAALTLLPAWLAGRPAPPGTGGAGGSPGRLRPGGRVTPFERGMSRLGGAAAAWAVARRHRVLAAAGLLALAAAAGLPRLAVETRLAGYFPPQHPARAALEELEAHGVGAVTAELVLSRPVEEGSGGFREPAVLAELAHLTGDLRREPRVLGAVGPGDLMEALVRSLVVEGEVDDDLRWLVLGLADSDPAARRLLAALLPPGGGSARVSLGVPLVGYQDLEPLLTRVVAQARQRFPGAEVWVTGEYPLVLAAQRTLLRTLATSLALTLGVVAAVFLLLLRRPGLALRALLPNLWPVLLVLGLMGWLGVALDGPTVMVAAVVLGLAVDDTLHTLGGLRHAGASRPPVAGVVEASDGGGSGRAPRGRSATQPRRGAKRLSTARSGARLESPEMWFPLRRTLWRIAPAHVLTSSLLVSGFGVCALVGFLPVARFGALTAAGVAAALAGDLLLLPALLGPGVELGPRQQAQRASAEGAKA